MKAIKRLSKKAIEFCELSNLDVNKIKDQMKSVNPFYICTTISETKDHSVDFNYPYVVVDSYRFIKLNP